MSDLDIQHCLVIVLKLKVKSEALMLGSKSLTWQTSRKVTHTQLPDHWTCEKIYRPIIPNILVTAGGKTLPQHIDPSHICQNHIHTVSSWLSYFIKIKPNNDLSLGTASTDFVGAEVKQWDVNQNCFYRLCHPLPLSCYLICHGMSLDYRDFFRTFFFFFYRTANCNFLFSDILV